MKITLLAVLALISSIALAHEGVERGPNGGRILEFSKDETMHGEVTVKEGRFHIALLDKDLKPVAVQQQSLTATKGDRNAPVKLKVEAERHGFLVPLVEPGQWLILQFKNTPDAKAVTARLEFNTDICEGCQAQEWLCQCKPDKAK